MNSKRRASMRVLAAVAACLSLCPACFVVRPRYDVYGTELDRRGAQVILWPTSEAGEELAYWVFGDEHDPTTSRRVGHWPSSPPNDPLPADLPQNLVGACVLLPVGASCEMRATADRALARLHQAHPSLSTHVVVGAAPPPDTDDACSLQRWLREVRAVRQSAWHWHLWWTAILEAVFLAVLQVGEDTRIVAPLDGDEPRYALSTRGPLPLPHDSIPRRITFELSAEELATALEGGGRILVVIPAGTPPDRSVELLRVLEHVAQSPDAGDLTVLIDALTTFDELEDPAAFEAHVVEPLD